MRCICFEISLEEFDHGDLGPQTTPDRAQLQSDDTGADDHQMLRHRGQFESAGRGDDGLLVDLDAWQRGHFRAGGDDDGLGGQSTLLAALVGDFHLSGSGDLAGTDHIGDLVLLEEELDTLGVVRDNLGLAGHHGGQIQFDLTDLDAMFGEVMTGGLVVVRRMQQRLGRNAADVQAGAAQGAALFNAGDLQAQLSSADGGDITAGTAADDDHIKRILAHGSPTNLFITTEKNGPSPGGGAEFTITCPAECAAGPRCIP